MDKIRQFEQDRAQRRVYPECVENVSGGRGSDALLIIGEEKTALYDCGMPYCHAELVENIEKALKKHGRETLDYVLMSHSHYDHVGGLPAVLERWSGVVVYGSAKCKSVFESENARKVIEKLSANAGDTYANEEQKKRTVCFDSIRVDETVGEGSRIPMGKDQYIYVLETKGHTDCSLTFVLEPESIMFASESTGVMRDRDYISVAMLKSCKDTIEAAEKCKAYAPKTLICSHYGVVPKDFIPEYFDTYIKMTEIEKKLVLELNEKAGGDFDGLLKLYTEHYWNPERESEQPYEAFIANAIPIIKTVLREFA